MGNVASVTRLAGTPAAVATSFAYESNFNQVATVTDALAHTIQYAYDTQGNLTGETAPLNNFITFTYNTAGQTTSLSYNSQPPVQYIYSLGDLAEIVNPLGNHVTDIRDGMGRVVISTDPVGNTTRRVYNGLNALVGVTDPLQISASMAFDSNSNLIGLTNGLGGTTGYAYDNMDRPSSRADALLPANTASLVYDEVGNLREFGNRKGQATTITYDALNRVTQVLFADTSTIAYAYDPASRLIQVTDSMTGAITRTYDGLDRVTAETTPQGTVNYTYDAAGRRSSMTVQGQPVVTYAYDDANRLTSISRGTLAVGLLYDAAGRRSTLSLPNNVTVTYGYDISGRLTSLAYQRGADVLGHLTYTYDNAGRRTGIGGSFARVALPQALGSAVHNPNNAVVQWGSTTITYDADGNLTSDGVRTYIWDARNRLSSISGPGLTASFQYDALGRRIRKTVNSITTDFLYDGINPVQELSGGVANANVLGGLSPDQFFARIDASGAFTFLSDALGSTLGLVDSEGNLQAQYTYEPFGRTDTTGGASSNSLRYTGREDDGTGLYYYRARYYSPTLQRFISEDPLDFRAGFNAYTYVLNSPLNGVDPSGLIVMVCSRPAFREVFPGVGLGNHAYFWVPGADSMGRESCGLLNPNNSEQGPPGDTCVVVPGSQGSEDALMDCCDSTNKFYKKLPVPPYIPFKQDCQTLPGECIKQVGYQNPQLKDPGVPGGRLGKRCDACTRPIPGFPGRPLFF
jgi:RHS repeat-associated protein